MMRTKAGREWSWRTGEGVDRPCCNAWRLSCFTQQLIGDFVSHNASCRYALSYRVRSVSPAQMRPGSRARGAAPCLTVGKYRATTSNNPADATKTCIPTKLCLAVCGRFRASPITGAHRAIPASAGASQLGKRLRPRRRDSSSPGNFRVRDSSSPSPPCASNPPQLLCPHTKHPLLPIPAVCEDHMSLPRHTR
jgi:hypothetical protein